MRIAYTADCDTRSTAGLERIDLKQELGVSPNDDPTEEVRGPLLAFASAHPNLSRYPRLAELEAERRPAAFHNAAVDFADWAEAQGVLLIL